MTYIKDKGFEDVFGKLIADGVTNRADLASHYPYSPERWRFFETDTSESNRILLQYNTDSRYSHQRFDGTGEYDVHTLSPTASETLIFKSAETYRYVVGNVSSYSWAFSVNQSLQSGDVIQIGAFDDADSDGYGVEFNSTLGDTQAELFILRNGTKVATKTVDIQDYTDKFTRLEQVFAWYNIAACNLNQTYTENNGDEITDKVGAVSVDSGRGPRKGNLPFTLKVTTGSGTSNLEVYMGSIAVQVYTKSVPIKRTKTIPLTGLSYGGSGDYEVLAAFRRDPDNDLVDVEFDQVEALEFTGTDDVFVLLQGVSSQNVRDSGGNLLVDADFEYAPETSSVNSAIQYTTNAAQFPDSTGTLQTSAANPGGFQMGYASLYESGAAPNAPKTARQRIQKRNIKNNDYVVLLARTRGATSGNLTIEITTEQDW